MINGWYRKSLCGNYLKSILIITVHRTRWKNCWRISKSLTMKLHWGNWSLNGLNKMMKMRRRPNGKPIFTKPWDWSKSKWTYYTLNRSPLGIGDISFRHFPGKNYLPLDIRYWSLIDWSVLRYRWQVFFYPGNDF